jgi:hypothetical protein
MDLLLSSLSESLRMIVRLDADLLSALVTTDK